MKPQRKRSSQLRGLEAAAGPRALSLSLMTFVPPTTQIEKSLRSLRCPVRSRREDRNAVSAYGADPELSANLYGDCTDREDVRIRVPNELFNFEGLWIDSDDIRRPLTRLHAALSRREQHAVWCPPHVIDAESNTHRFALHGRLSAREANHRLTSPS